MRSIYEKTGMIFSRLHPLSTLYSRSEHRDTLSYCEIYSMIYNVY